MGRIHVFYDDNTFVGFVCILNYLDIINILYLAVDKNVQGKGYGRAILEFLKKTYTNHRFIADIEKDEDGCPNRDMRRKRELFYLHDDYRESGIEYNYKGVDYIIMVANGNITKKEFAYFWRKFSNIDPLGRHVTFVFKEEFD